MCALYGRVNTVLTYRDLLTETEQSLENATIHCGHGYESPHDEAVALVLAAADLPISTGVEILDLIVPEVVQARLSNWLHERIEQRRPVAYIIERAWLGALCFDCDERALVPRSPIMELVEEGFEPWLQNRYPSHIIDVCCGGGSLGLLAAMHFADAKVTLADIDEQALALAHQNIVNHQLAERVSLQLGDLLGAFPPESADIILANPPYVDALDMACLPPEYHHEPRHALAAGEDGLDLVHRLLQQARDVLKPHGLLFLEVGNSWEALGQAYPHFPFLWLDLSCGGHGVTVLTHADLVSVSAVGRV